SRSSTSKLCANWRRPSRLSPELKASKHMHDLWRSVLPKPRSAVRKMAPYSPPTGGRLGKTRLDFNENTVGCSPKVIEFLKSRLTEETLTVYPDYAGVKRTLAAFFKVSEGELLLTNGTDEAIQVLINTYVDDNDEVIVLRPSFAM